MGAQGAEGRGLLGREDELARIDGLIAAARDGQSSVLVIQGEPGIGKTELMGYASRQATGFTRLAVRGFEAESEPAFSHLADLFRPLRDLMPRLTPQQAAALQAAIGAAASPATPGDRFVVYTATLSLIAHAAEKCPLLVIVDDAHWLDEPSAEALVFAARRLDREGVVVLFGMRSDEPGTELFKTLPAMNLKGLSRDAASELFMRSTSRKFTSKQAARLYDLTKGNPLAVRELGRMVVEEGIELEGAQSAHISMGPIVESAFRRRFERLDARVRSALVVAASSDSGRMTEIGSALRGLDLAVQDLESAEEIGLIRIEGGSLAFDHPVVRSLVYQTASPSFRRKVHAALAEALAAEDPDRHAWHLAQSVVEPSEPIALAVEQAAVRALERTGYASAADLFKLAASLSPDGRSGVERQLMAGQAAQLAGRPEVAEALLLDALRRTDDVATRAEIEHTRARTYIWWRYPMRAHEILVRQAEQVATVDPVKAAYLLAEAAAPCIQCAKLELALETAERGAHIASSLSAEAGAMVDAVLAETLMLLGRTREAEPILERSAPVIERDAGFGIHPAISYLAQIEMATERYDDARRHVEGMIDGARRLGAIGILPYTLSVLSELDFRTGRWPQAFAGAAEAVRLAEETGQESVGSYALTALSRVEAAIGQLDARDHVERAVEVAKRLGTNSIITYGYAALGLLELGLGNLEAAVAALDEVANEVAGHGLAEPNVVQWQPDHVEALARTGRFAEADRRIAVLDGQARVTARQWAMAAGQRARGVLAHAQQKSFAEFFEKALELADPRWHQFDIARTHLCYGEALRRTKQHTRAREHLRVALAEFERLGARPWEEKARSELVAAGDRTTPRLATSGADLSPQELQVALTVAQGLSNREVANRLFLSTKTIESHLGRVYSKMGIRSRSQLVHQFATRESSLPA